MKKFYLLAILLCCMTSIIAQNAKPFVIPELKEWKGSTGEFTLNENTRIVYPKTIQRHRQLQAHRYPRHRLPDNNPRPLGPPRLQDRKRTTPTHRQGDMPAWCRPTLRTLEI